MKCKNLSLKKFLKIIKNPEKWEDNKGLFWTKENTMFVGMDNTSGDAWVEEFETFRECINWLLGIEG